MNAASASVLTIGHSTHDSEAFVALLQRHGVTDVADIRSSPYSRFNPQFNREALANRLAACGIEYAFLGRELGGHPDDASCYENGRVRYDRVRKTRSFQKGVEQIVRDIANHRIALMCSEKEPLECHRTLLVAQALQAQGVTVEHILADGELETHAAVMDRLLALHDDPRQEDLFRPRDERIARAIQRAGVVLEHVETGAQGDLPQDQQEAPTTVCERVCGQARHPQGRYDGSNGGNFRWIDRETSHV